MNNLTKPRIMHKRILLLASDVSDNALGRVWILADMLARHAQVEILGLGSKGAVWTPLSQDTSHRITVIPAEKGANSLGTCRLARAVWNSNADAIYICKPKFPNMMAALLARRGRPLALDIDDWEAGCARGGFTDNAIINFLAARGISFTQLADWMIPLIPTRTVSNIFLQERYGGQVIPHARNAPAFEQAVSPRATFGLPEQASIVMFYGTPHRHKGVSELIEAMHLASPQALHMVIAGLDPHMREYKEYYEAATRKLGNRFTFLPFVPWQQSPALLSCADIIVVPQKMTLFTRWGQTPAKVFDAMAAGKPLIVSDIADIADIVGNTAWLVAPDSPEAIAGALAAICRDPKAASDKAARAKARFRERFSYDSVAPRLALALGKLLN
jgi:glycosyltransferase involved in cell wall biosynthesis